MEILTSRNLDRRIIISILFTPTIRTRSLLRGLGEYTARARDVYKRQALSSGFTRFRPVLMTALAMIIGMLPMSLGLGEGGEQNAPLGRAVIGGLLFATAATLFFVPVFFSVVHGSKAKKEPLPVDPQLGN